MDFLKNFDIQMEKNVYFAGEIISGHATVENIENVKIRAIHLALRGRGHAEWKIMRNGERRTVKEDEHLLEDKVTLWGKEVITDEAIPILPKGFHQFPFRFRLPQLPLPCSFESKAGTIRYFIKMVIDIPYSNSPRCLKYFTLIGPNIDCMEEKYLTPMVGQDEQTTCCFCCRRGPVALRLTLERSAYVSGENIRVLVEVENHVDQDACVKLKLEQNVEYFIAKGVLGVNRNSRYTVLEHRSPRIPPFSKRHYDTGLENSIKLPIVPPTLIGVCRLIQIYYVLKACLEMERGGDRLCMEFPFTVGTIPCRPSNGSVVRVGYGFCSSHVEGGMYVSPEFQLGQVYDGSLAESELTIIYRPLYVTVVDRAEGLLAKQNLITAEAGNRQQLERPYERFIAIVENADNNVDQSTEELLPKRKAKSLDTAIATRTWPFKINPDLLSWDERSRAGDLPSIQVYRFCTEERTHEHDACPSHSTGMTAMLPDDFITTTC